MHTILIVREGHLQFKPLDQQIVMSVVILFHLEANIVYAWRGISRYGYSEVVLKLVNRLDLAVY